MVKKRRILSVVKKWLDRDEVIVIEGPRRVGKTTLLHLIRNFLKSQGIPDKRIFLLDLEDFDVLRELNQSPRKLLNYITAQKEKNYFLIDEIQYLEDPSHFLKYIYDEHRRRVKLIVTGSFFLEAKARFANSLVGRKITFHLPPLCFEEFISFREPGLVPYFTKEDPPARMKGALAHYLEEYLVFGGMPEIVLAPEVQTKKLLLKEYVNTYVNRDIRHLAGGKEVLGYNDLLVILARQAGSLINISELSNTLRLPRRKVETYLENLHLASLIYLIPPYFRNIRSQISKMKKVYLFDIGVRNQLIHDFNGTMTRVDAGALFENFILNELQQGLAREYVYYYRNKAGSEIDFVIRGRVITPLEVKHSELLRPTGFKAIAHMVKEGQLPRGFVVNLSLNQRLDNGIEIMDYLRFLKTIPALG